MQLEDGNCRFFSYNCQWFPNSLILRFRLPNWKVTEVLDLKSNIWTRGPDAPHYILRSQAIASPGNDVLLFLGGYQYETCVQEFSIAKMKWTLSDKRLPGRGRRSFVAMEIPSKLATCTKDQIQAPSKLSASGTPILNFANKLIKVVIFFPRHGRLDNNWYALCKKVTRLAIVESEFWP